MTDELRLDTFGAVIHWCDLGTGSPLVVLPGLSLPVSMFEYLSGEPCLAGRRPVLIDYLGSGASDYVAGFDLSLPSHAECIGAVLEHLGLRQVDVLGYSMGGTVAIHLALDHPGAVGRLAVAEGNSCPAAVRGRAGSRVCRAMTSSQADFRLC